MKVTIIEHSDYSNVTIFCSSADNSIMKMRALGFKWVVTFKRWVKAFENYTEAQSFLNANFEI